MKSTMILPYYNPSIIISKRQFILQNLKQQTSTINKRNKRFISGDFRPFLPHLQYWLEQYILVVNKKSALKPLLI